MQDYNFLQTSEFDSFHLNRLLLIFEKNFSFVTHSRISPARGMMFVLQFKVKFPCCQDLFPSLKQRESQTLPPVSINFSNKDCKSFPFNFSFNLKHEKKTVIITIIIVVVVVKMQSFGRILHSSKI